MKVVVKTISQKVRFWTPVFLWMAVIFTFSSIPQIKTTQIYWQDFAFKKFAHMAEYGILTVFIYRALLSDKVPAKKAALMSVIIAGLYGASDEFHQSFTPGREPHVRDVMFDTIGASIAAYYLWKLLPQAPKKLKSWAHEYHLL